MERVLFLNGTIAEDSWFDDDVTPQLFKDELFSGNGDVTVWINSPGGDCVAAAQIYNMLMDYKGNIMAQNSEVNALFRLRAIPNLLITNKHYILCGGVQYNIYSVENVRNRGMYLEILACGQHLTSEV